MCLYFNSKYYAASNSDRTERIFVATAEPTVATHASKIIGVQLNIFFAKEKCEE